MKKNIICFTIGLALTISTSQYVIAKSFSSAHPDTISISNADQQLLSKAIVERDWNTVQKISHRNRNFVKYDVSKIEDVLKTYDKCRDNYDCLRDVGRKLGEISKILYVGNPTVDYLNSFIKKFRKEKKSAENNYKKKLEEQKSKKKEARKLKQKITIEKIAQEEAVRARKQKVAEEKEKREEEARKRRIAKQKNEEDKAIAAEKKSWSLAEDGPKFSNKALGFALNKALKNKNLILGKEEPTHIRVIKKDPKNNRGRLVRAYGQILNIALRDDINKGSKMVEGILSTSRFGEVYFLCIGEYKNIFEGSNVALRGYFVQIYYYPTRLGSLNPAPVLIGYFEEN